MIWQGGADAAEADHPKKLRERGQKIIGSLLASLPPGMRLLRWRQVTVGGLKRSSPQSNRPSLFCGTVLGLTVSALAQQAAAKTRQPSPHPRLLVAGRFPEGRLTTCLYTIQIKTSSYQRLRSDRGRMKRRFDRRSFRRPQAHRTGTRTGGPPNALASARCASRFFRSAGWRRFGRRYSPQRPTPSEPDHLLFSHQGSAVRRGGMP